MRVNDRASGTNSRGEPVDIDRQAANAARVYDYLLGGTANFEVDRAAGEQSSAAFPGGIDGARASVRSNRDFLARAVRYLAGEVGIRQFLDLGTGIPNEHNVHHLAQQVAPDARVVGVDYDPVVLAHAHELLRSTPEGAVAFIDGDFREPEAVLEQAADTLDFSRPVAVMLVAILHLIDDDNDPYGLVGRLMDAVPSGSYLAMTHLTNDLLDMAETARILTEAMREPMVLRTRAEFARFFDGLELVEPGVVPVDEWRPDTPPTGTFIAHYAAVARKP